MPADLLIREKTYLRKHQAELARKYPGRQYVVIQGETVYGAYETYDQGVIEGIKLLGAGPFLVRSWLHPEDPEPVNIPVISLGIPTGADSLDDHSDAAVEIG